MAQMYLQAAQLSVYGQSLRRCGVVPEGWHVAGHNDYLGDSAWRLQVSSSGFRSESVS